MRFVVHWMLVGFLFGIDSLAESTDVLCIKMESEKAFQAALARFQSDTSSVENAWNLARLAFEFGEHLDPSDLKESVANQGIAAARHCIEQSYGLAEGHYYLALNLGQLARCRTLGALKLVREMEKAFLKARDLNASVDFAGPDRCLGRLYLMAPGWPASIGSSRKAIEHLTEALRIHPEYPGNALQLVHACQTLNRSDDANHYYLVTRDITKHMDERWSERLPPVFLRKWHVLLEEIKTELAGES